MKTIKYIKPVMTAIDVELKSNIMGSSKFNPTEAPDDMDAGINGRRGKWGDFWTTDKEK